MGAYKTTTAGGLVEERSTNLALCVAKARALRMRGYPAFIKDESGYSIEITGRADGEFATKLPAMQHGTTQYETKAPWVSIVEQLLTTAVQD